MQDRALGKTIITYLVNNSGSGIKLLSILYRPIKCLYVPRARFGEAKSREELKCPSLYFLFYENKEAYIGQTTNFLQREYERSKNKPWNELLIFSSSPPVELDLGYLEYIAIKEAKEANTFNLEQNKQQPKEKNYPEWHKAPLSEFFRDVKLLTSFLGYELFDILNPKKENIFYCNNNRGTNAKGAYYDKGFTVFEESKIRKKQTPSCKIDRSAYLVKGGYVEHESYFELTKNIRFNNPSISASFCLGTQVNGWKAWKNKNSKTLDEMVRKNC